MPGVNAASCVYIDAEAAALLTHELSSTLPPQAGGSTNFRLQMPIDQRGSGSDGGCRRRLSCSSCLSHRCCCRFRVPSGCGLQRRRPWQAAAPVQKRPRHLPRRHGRCLRAVGILLRNHHCRCRRSPRRRWPSSGLSFAGPALERFPALERRCSCRHRAQTPAAGGLLPGCGAAAAEI